jgi:hypothetical protein
MNDDVRRSRARISRRRALGLGGTVSLGALVAACTGSPSSAALSASRSAPSHRPSTAPSEILALLVQANTCVMNDAVFATSPYDGHTGRDTRNEDDSIYDPSGLMTVRRTASGHLGAINIGVST